MSFNKGEVFAMTQDWTAVTNKDHKYLGQNSKRSMANKIQWTHIKLAADTPSEIIEYKDSRISLSKF